MADAQNHHSELSALRQRLVDCEQRLAILPAWQEEARLAAADREELDRLRDRVEALEGQLTEAEELRVRSESVVDDMKASLSWRLTSPLRRLKRRHAA